MKVGDYVRVKDDLGIQLICKIEKIIYEYFIHTDKGYWDQEHIIKSSPNIIDLIEVGDYVNGCYVEDIGKTFVDVARGSNYFKTPTIFENEIKSILTKEQFKNWEYMIGE